MQVFQEVYSQHTHFEILEAVHTEAKFPVPFGDKQLRAIWPDDHAQLNQFTSHVHSLLKKEKDLRKVVIPEAAGPAASLISQSSYKVTAKGGEDATRKICRIAFGEASKSRLDARRRFLANSQAASLRTAMWLTVNRMLACDPHPPDGIARKFSFWDGIRDNLQTSVIGGGVYSEAVAIEAGRSYAEDLQERNKLGDLLTTSKALANNRGDPPSERVIDERSKELIDQLLKVWVWK